MTATAMAETRRRGRILDEAESWEPACMTADELEGWRAINRGASAQRARRPCADCPVGFALEQRVLGTCNGEPAGAEAGDDAEDDRFLATDVGPDRRLVRLLEDAVAVPPPPAPRGRVSVFSRFVPLEVAVEPPPQPDPSIPVDAAALLEHVRGVGFATAPVVNSGADHANPMHQEEEPMPATPLAERIAEATPSSARECAYCHQPFVPARRPGRPAVACTPEHQRLFKMAEEARRKREQRAAAVHGEAQAPSVEYEPADPAPLERSTSTDQAPATPDLVVAEPMAAAIDPVIASQGTSEPAAPLHLEAPAATDVAPDELEADDGPDDETLVGAWRVALAEVQRERDHIVARFAELGTVEDYLRAQLEAFTS